MLKNKEKRFENKKKKMEKITSKAQCYYTSSNNRAYVTYVFFSLSLFSIKM